MKISTSVDIDAQKKLVWTLISDIENADKNISAIEKIEILSRPDKGLIGLKWRETRRMFGKKATEIMWITEAKENNYYQTRAESHGAVYKSRMAIKDKEEGCTLTMSFQGEAITLFTKVMNAIFAGMMKKSMVKTMQEDLLDIKSKAESL